MIAATVAFTTRHCLVWMIAVPWNGSSHTRWRYDKSKSTFTIRKYQRVRHPFLDPVGAAIRLLHHADDLVGVPAKEPLGVFKHLAKPSYRDLSGL
jgi:hypothetical protein